MIFAYASYGHGIFQIIERGLILSAVWKFVRDIPLPVTLGIVAVVLVVGWLFRAQA